MKKLLVLLIVAILLVGCEQKKEENNDNVEVVNNPQPTTTVQNTNKKFEIKNEYIEEKQFVIDPQVDNEGYMDCKINFWEGKAYYTDGFGNVLRGPYEISGDSITINFNMLDAEYSEKPQQLDVDVHLKMLDETTIIVAETPPPYTVKTSTFVDGNWVFDSGEKEMTFLGFVKDYRFYKVPVVGKIDDTKEWVYDAEYTKDVKAPSYEVWEQTYSAEDIVVPYINIDSDYARKVNAEIKEAFNKIVAHYNEGVEDGFSYVDTCEYTTYEYENGLFVLFTYGLGATDVVHPVYCAYSFDLVDGSKMDLDFFCNFIGLSKPVVQFSIETNIEKMVREEMKSFDEEEIKTYVDLSKKSFADKFESEDVDFTIVGEGDPFFVVDIQIPAGTGHFDTLVGVYD